MRADHSGACGRPGYPAAVTEDPHPERAEHLAPMRAQVYRDPRPADLFDRFHERSRTREPDWVYEAIRVLTSIYAWTFFRARASGAEKVPASGPLQRPPGVPRLPSIF